MKKLYGLGIVSAALLGFWVSPASAQFVPLGPGPAPGGSVCYISEGLAGETGWNDHFRLNIEHHSNLTGRRDYDRFGHAIQETYSVHGKWTGRFVDSEVLDQNGGGELAMITVTGTLITAKPPLFSFGFDGSKGTRLGLRRHSALDVDPDFASFLDPFEMDCTSAESSPLPNRFLCAVWFNEPPLKITFRMVKVDPADRLCSVFIDGELDRSGDNLVGEKKRTGGKERTGGNIDTTQ
jgi:hypothetical protein